MHKSYLLEAKFVSSDCRVEELLFPLSFYLLLRILHTKYIDFSYTSKVGYFMPFIQNGNITFLAFT